MTTKHACPVPNCSAMVKPEVFMCARHWRMVPKPLQQSVYESYRTTGRISDNHREATRIVAAAENGRMMPGITPGMKALTLWQPWASLIMIGAKPYEFRKWNFADKPHLEKLIGQRIVIHAGARSIKAGELEDILDRIDQGESALASQLGKTFIKSVLGGMPIPMASALGTAVIGRPQRSFDLFKHIVADSDRLDQQMYAWPVSDPQPFPQPVPASGAQGFWNWS
jgi:hypothetical protein